MAENKRDDSYIVVKDLNKYFYDTPEPMKILEDISFTVKKGEMVCLVGSSGCGKSHACFGQSPVWIPPMREPSP